MASRDVRDIMGVGAQYSNAAPLQLKKKAPKVGGGKRLSSCPPL
jgi:hypothetical protein